MTSCKTSRDIDMIIVHTLCSLGATKCPNAGVTAEVLMDAIRAEYKVSFDLDVLVDKLNTGFKTGLYIKGLDPITSTPVWQLNPKFRKSNPYNASLMPPGANCAPPGWVDIQPYCDSTAPIGSVLKVTLSTDQPAVTSGSAVFFNFARGDISGFDETTYSFFPPVTGVYSLNIQLILSGGDGTWREIDLSGVGTIYRLRVPFISGTPQPLSISGTFNLVKDYRVSVSLRHDAGTLPTILYQEVPESITVWYITRVA